MISKEKTKTFPAGTSLYHYSVKPDQLVSSGAFDMSRAGVGRMVFLTPQPVIGTNTEVVLGNDVKTLDFDKMSDEEFEAMVDTAENSYKPAVQAGFDGRIQTQGDPYTQLPEGGICSEVAIFEEALHKIAVIRRYQGE